MTEILKITLYTENETNLHLIDPKYFVLKMDDCVKLSIFSVTMQQRELQREHGSRAKTRSVAPLFPTHKREIACK